MRLFLLPLTFRTDSERLRYELSDRDYAFFVGSRKRKKPVDAEQVAIRALVLRSFALFIRIVASVFILDVRKGFIVVNARKLNFAWVSLSTPFGVEAQH